MDKTQVFASPTIIVKEIPSPPEVDEILGRGRELREAAKALVECVERYTYPKGQKLCRRSELLVACNKLKELL